MIKQIRRVAIIGMGALGIMYGHFLSKALGDLSLVFIADRKEAIRTALMFSHEGAAVLLAGKGHETYQIIGTEKRHFDEREVVGEVFAAMKNLDNKE